MSFVFRVVFSANSKFFAIICKPTIYYFTIPTSHEKLITNTNYDNIYEVYVHNIQVHS